MTVGVLLLAAGQGRRFGSDKRSALLPTGRTLLAATVDIVRQAGLPLRVCLRPGEDAVAAEAGLSSVDIIACSQAQFGMGRTLAEGVSRLPEWEGFLIALADMPSIKAETFLKVAAGLQLHTIVVPTWRGTPGHPVGFGKAWLPQLAILTGDSGARDIVRGAGLQRHLLAVDDPGVVQDIDLPVDMVGHVVTPP